MTTTTSGRADGLDTDVIILGAGPVGLTIANLLGQRGVSVIQLEARRELIDYPRAVGIDDEAMRVMQTVGLVDEVLPHTVPDQKIRMVNAEGAIIGEVDPTTREYGWPRRNGFVQPLVDRVLVAGLERFETVEVRFGCEAIDLTQDDDAASATYRDRDGGTTTLRARYVVAAEGGNSFTRKHLGISFDGETRKNRGLVLDIADDPLGTPNAVFGGDPTRPWATLSLPHGIRRWEFTMLDGEPDEIVEDDAFIAGLLAGHLPDPTRLNIIRRRVYTFNARVAGKFRVGRVLLAGDAAHVMPVVAGQGWNSGIRDAVNLSWKLADVVRGHAGDELLDTYETERMGHVKQMVDLSQSMADEMTDLDPERARARDEAAARRTPEEQAVFRDQAFKPQPNYESGVVLVAPPRVYKTLPDRPTTRAAGTLFPQPTVRTADGAEALLDDATGQGWRVLVWNNDPLALLSPKSVSAIGCLGGALVHAVPAVQLPWARQRAATGSVVVGDLGALRSWFDQRRVSAVIIRPDHVVAAECLAQELDDTLQQVLALAHVTHSARVPSARGTQQSV